MPAFLISLNIANYRDYGPTLIDSVISVTRHFIYLYSEHDAWSLIMIFKQKTNILFFILDTFQCAIQQIPKFTKTKIRINHIVLFIYGLRSRKNTEQEIYL